MHTCMTHRLAAMLQYKNHGGFRCLIKMSMHRNCNNSSEESIFSMAYSLTLATARRDVVQSHKSCGLRNIFDQYRDRQLIQKLNRNGCGNYYRYQQKLWTSVNTLERDLTSLQYSSMERMPLGLLPKRSASRQVLVCEGRGARALLEHAEHCESKETQVSHDSVTEATTTVGHGDDIKCDPTVVCTASMEAERDFTAMLLGADQGINNKILTSQDVEGTVLSSARERSRKIIQENRCTSTLTTPTTGMALRRPSSARDISGASWSALGLDPLLARLAADHYGLSPSRLQARLLPALLHEDHHDVLFNGVTGSGKTSALLLAILQGARSESAGLNVLVASSAMSAIRMHDAVRALCQRGGGGAVMDRPSEDFSWVLLGTSREDYQKYYALFRGELNNPHGPPRIFITMADVFCELLFEKKMEFEAFGYLRRVYVDDVSAQIPRIGSTASVAEARERLRNPAAVELLLGTLHQLPGPHVRSLLQLGLVSADVDEELKNHLKALCIKPQAHTIVLSPVRVPSTIHCLFSFFLAKQDRFEYLAKLIWNARLTIPGRGIIFVRDEEDLLQIRRTLRGLGLNVKIFSEVYANGQFQAKWKFLLMKESEAFAVDLPLVSHVFVTFAPPSPHTFLHMCGRTGRLGNVGWVYAVADGRDAKHVRHVAEDLSIDFTEHVIDVNLNKVRAETIHRLTADPTLFGMDPQYAVHQHYEIQAEHSEMAYRSREFFSKPAHKQFQMEDYTPVNTLQRRFENAKKLAKDIEHNPSIAVDMMRKGLLDAKLRPTKFIKQQMDLPTSRRAPAPFR